MQPLPGPDSDPRRGAAAGGRGDRPAALRDEHPGADPGAASGGFSYAEVGVVSGAWGLAIGVTAPLLGRAVDRLGQTWVLVTTACLSLAAQTALVAAALSGAGVIVLAAIAVVGGASNPPISPSMRTLWPELVGRERVDTAFAFDALQLELFFITGPLIVVAIAGAASPQAAFVTAAVMSAAGAIGFAGTRASRRWRPSSREPAEPAERALRARHALADSRVRDRRHVAGGAGDSDSRLRRAGGLTRGFGLALRPLGARLTRGRTLVRRSLLAPAGRSALPALHRRAGPGPDPSPLRRLDVRVCGDGRGGRSRAGPVDCRRLFPHRRALARGRHHGVLRLADRRLRDGRRARRVAGRNLRGRAERDGRSGAGARDRGRAPCWWRSPG